MPSTTRGLLPLVCMLSTFSLQGCFLFSQGKSDRVSDEQIQKIRAGMTIEQAHEILGRPLQVVVNVLDDSREVHQYRSNGQEYIEKQERYDPESDTWETEFVKSRQLQIVELLFVDGVLVKESGS